ncbi:MAG TPA: hypothetical protein VNS79_02130 [Sphingobium sp.]|nr:hypothetical protein [Sphingobium sp.]
MRLALVGPAVIGAMVLAMPALAQGNIYAPTGTRIGRPAPAKVPDNVSMSDADKARMTVSQFADCIVRTDKKQTQRYLAATFRSAESGKIVNDLATSECLWNANLRMPYELLRGAIFRSVYAQNFAASALRFPDEPVDYTGYLDDKTSPDAIRYLILMDFADCVARADASSVRAFVLAPPASQTEKAALTTLQPQLGPCFPAGANVTFNKSVLSAILAEALYREVEAGQSISAEASR